MARTITHAFDIAIGVMVSQGEALLDGLADDDPVRSRVSALRTAAERAAGLAHELVAFSQERPPQGSACEHADP
jgi:hypothetical protein